ncbi:MAG: hypothetical protein A4E57_00220 [Syntrophorhabdaceae bacterium PtaU1.Bin034]|nr:MAG: hypothetical protein A4E57_00220 [Syntrophorhabdaceae bacterium PtaU1.Bin034]
MKRDFLRFLLALSLIAAPVSPAFAGTDTLSDNELASVNAKGFAVEASNNNASVQLYESQNGIKGVSVVNIAGSAANVGQNLTSVSETVGIALLTQKNEQYSDNTGGGFFQTTYNTDWPGDADNYYNNNASVQGMGSGSETGIRALSLANVAGSAFNVGQNIAKVEVNYFVDMLQSNEQEAVNDFLAVQTVVNEVGALTYQSNSNATAQLIDSQNWAKGLSIANVAASAPNVGQNVANVKGEYFVGVGQISIQEAEAVIEPIQVVANDNWVRYQTNNNASAQGVDSQNWAQAVSLLNAAASTVNVGQNIANVKADKFAYIGQANVQFTENDIEATQLVVNGDADAKYQANNNASVRFVDSQNGAKAVSIANLAASAVNIGQNIANVKVEENFEVEQFNIQAAVADIETTQVVFNADDAKHQANNNASVQLVGSQNEARALSIANLAASAANIGQNIAKVKAEEDFGVEQFNIQAAVAEIEPTQVVKSDEVKYQRNNSASVALVGSQNEARALSIANLAASAANIGQNIAKVEAEEDFGVEQVNVQAVVADIEISQTVANADTVKHQANNKGTVALRGSQNWASALAIINAAASAVNIGQNIAGISGQRDIDVFQTNNQTASVATFPNQTLENDGTVIYQANNGTSVRLIDSQSHASGLVIANVAGSGVNIGQNITSLRGLLGGSVSVVNTQTAYR